MRDLDWVSILVFDDAGDQGGETTNADERIGFSDDRDRQANILRTFLTNVADVVMVSVEVLAMVLAVILVADQGVVWPPHVPTVHD